MEPIPMAAGTTGIAVQRFSFSAITSTIARATRIHRRVSASSAVLVEAAKLVEALGGRYSEAVLCWRPKLQAKVFGGSLTAGPTPGERRERKEIA